MPPCRGCKKGWDSVPYQSTHNTGGAIMGGDPKTSAVNNYLQSWDVPNVFVIGASAFAAQCRHESHRHGGGAGLLGGAKRSPAIYQDPRRAGAGMKASGAHGLRCAGGWSSPALRRPTQ